LPITTYLSTHFALIVDLDPEARTSLFAPLKPLSSLACILLHAIKQLH